MAVGGGLMCVAPVHAPSRQCDHTSGSFLHGHAMPPVPAAVQLPGPRRRAAAQAAATSHPAFPRLIQTVRCQNEREGPQTRGPGVAGVMIGRADGGPAQGGAQDPDGLPATGRKAELAARLAAAGKPKIPSQKFQTREGGCKNSLAKIPDKRGGAGRKMGAITAQQQCCGGEGGAVCIGY